VAAHRCKIFSSSQWDLVARGHLLALLELLKVKVATAHVVASCVQALREVLCLDLARAAHTTVLKALLLDRSWGGLGLAAEEHAAQAVTDRAAHGNACCRASHLSEKA